MGVDQRCDDISLHLFCCWSGKKTFQPEAEIDLVFLQIRHLWTALDEKHSYYLLSASLTVNFLVFLAFLLVLRCAEQIVQPYNVEHDVFELNRILNEKLEVAAFVLNSECDLRIRLQDKVLLP